MSARRAAPKGIFRTPMDAAQRGDARPQGPGLARAGIAIFVAATVLAAAGCAGPGAAPAGPPAPRTAFPPSGPALPPNALPVPLFRQANSYSCGAAALAAVLTYWGALDDGECALYAALETTPEDGTEPAKLVEVARAHGVSADLRQGLSLADLEGALSRGETVILDLQAWREDERTPWRERWEDGHYVVLVAMDAERVFVMDPSTSGTQAWLPRAELLERWHDYEDRHGKRIEYVRAGVFVRGARPAFPARPSRLE